MMMRVNIPWCKGEGFDVSKKSEFLTKIQTEFVKFHKSYFIEIFYLKGERTFIPTLFDVMKFDIRIGDDCTLYIAYPTLDGVIKFTLEEVQNFVKLTETNYEFSSRSSYACDSVVSIQFLSKEELTNKLLIEYTKKKLLYEKKIASIIDGIEQIP